MSSLSQDVFGLGGGRVTSVCCSCTFVGVPEQVMELADLELMMST